MDVKKIREQLQTDPALRNRVARRAFELFIKRGRQMGREAEDWFRAEEEILQELIRVEQQRLAFLEAEQRRQEQANASVSVAAATPTAEENNSKDVAVTPKKRTYTPRKKADVAISEEVKTEQTAASQVVSEPAKPRARRTKKNNTAQI